METSNIFIPDTFLLRRKYKLFEIVAKGSRCCTWAGLQLRLPPAGNRKPREMRLTKKTQILMLPAAPQVVCHARCRGALLSFHQDLIDAETSLTRISIPANRQIQKKKGFAGTLPNQVELSACLQDTLQIAARQEHEQSGVPLHRWCWWAQGPRGGFSAAWAPQQHPVPKQTGTTSYIHPAPTRGGLSSAKAAAPNACGHLTV